MRLDHVIYGTADLDAAQRRIEAELGLEVLPGGRHVGQGCVRSPYRARLGMFHTESSHHTHVDTHIDG